MAPLTMSACIYMYVVSVSNNTYQQASTRKDRVQSYSNFMAGSVVCGTADHNNMDH